MLMIWDWQSWFEMDSEQRTLLTVKGLGSLKVADVATVAEVYSPGPHAMMDMKELPARRQTCIYIFETNRYILKIIAF